MTMKIILDCFVAAAMLAVIYQVARYLRAYVNSARATLAKSTTDPFDTDIWKVLAEARRITHDAAE